MSSKTVFIDNLPFIRRSQTVRRVNQTPCFDGDDEEITLDLQKSMTFPWQAVGHARRTGPGDYQVQVEYLPRDQMRRGVTSKTVVRRNINVPSTPKQRAKLKQNPEFMLGHAHVTLEDLPHPSKLTKKKKFQQKKYLRHDLGRMYASQLKKKLEHFNLPELSYRQKNSNVIHYSEETMFDPSSSPNNGTDLVQQVPSTPTLTNNHTCTSSHVKLPSGISETRLLSHTSPTSLSSLTNGDNSNIPASSYKEECVPWSTSGSSQSSEWQESDQFQLNFLDSNSSSGYGSAKRVMPGGEEQDLIDMSWLHYRAT